MSCNPLHGPFHSFPPQSVGKENDAHTIIVFESNHNSRPQSPDPPSRRGQEEKEENEEEIVGSFTYLQREISVQNMSKQDEEGGGQESLLHHYIHLGDILPSVVCLKI